MYGILLCHNTPDLFRVSLVAITAYKGYVTYQSVDGGVTWSPSAFQLSNVARGGRIADSPWGRYTLDGPRVLRIGADVTQEEVVYSTEYLEEDGNVWVQKVATEKLNKTRKIAYLPLGIVYDDITGNLVVALGIQGVVVGTPDGIWDRVAVGQFEPSDFSFVGKTRRFLSDLEFWTASLALCVSMTALGLTASRFRLGPVHTKGSGHVIIHVWNLHKLITNSSNRTYPCSVAM